MWYYADGEEPVGPRTIQELKKTLATFANARDVLAWC